MNKKYTTFGYVLHIILRAAELTSFLLLIAFTCECENGGSVKSYLIKAAICLIIMGVTEFSHDKIFE